MTKLISCTFVAFISLCAVNSYAEDGEIVLKAAEQTSTERVQTNEAQTRTETQTQRSPLTLTTQIAGIEPDEID